MPTIESLRSKVESFCKDATKQEYGLVTPRVEKLCSELRSCSARISESDVGKWESKLERVRGTYSACDQAGGMQSACNPFFEKAQGLISECQNL